MASLIVSFGLAVTGLMLVMSGNVFKKISDSYGIKDIKMIFFDLRTQSGSATKHLFIQNSGFERAHKNQVAD